MSSERPETPVSTGLYVIHVLMLFVTAALVLSFSWTGFTASDDSYYVAGGRGWLHHFPFVADYFGLARELVNIPIALSLALFGDREFSVVLPTVLYFMAVLVLSYGALARLAGGGLALAAGLLMLTVPLFVLKATIPSADLALLFFASLSFWAFWAALGKDAGARAWRLFASGLAAGAALLSHELALALPLFFAVLFLRGFRIPRGQYFLILFGFLAVVGLNMLYYGVMTGDFLHRFHLMREGQALTVDRLPVPPFSFDDSGNFHIWAGIDPLVMLLTKQEFALLYYFALPAMIWLALQPRADALDARASDMLVLGRLLALLAVIWFLFAAFVLREAKLLPRYFMLPSWAAFVSMMLVAGILWRRGRRRFLIVAALAFVAVNLLAISVDNRNPRFAERALVRFLQTTSETVYSDPMTVDKADFFLQWAHLPQTRVRAAPPEPGSLYFHNPKNTVRPSRLIAAADLPDYQPRPGWTRVWTATEPLRPLPRLLVAVGIEALLPDRIRRKLFSPNPPVTVYRLDAVYAAATRNER